MLRELYHQGKVVGNSIGKHFEVVHGNIRRGQNVVGIFLGLRIKLAPRRGNAEFFDEVSHPFFEDSQTLGIGQKIEIATHDLPIAFLL